MIRIRLVQQWTAGTEGALDMDQRLVPALEAIQHTGSVSQAANTLGVSYRFLWGLLLHWGNLLGSPLAILERGRGAKLTSFGEKLLWADKRIAARLSPMLDSMASELELELQPMLSRESGVLRIHASHGFAVDVLREDLATAAIPVELKYIGSREALVSLRDEKCDLAGFHVPVGDLEALALRQFEQGISQPDFAVIELATRQQGLMTAIDNPKRIRQFRDLADLRCRFVNRQAGSGTRVLFDLLLAQKGIDASQITGYDVVEYTHAAVAAFVASGMADVGFGIETGARRFGLHFIPVATERYCFLCRKSRLQTAPVQAALQLMNSDDFKSKVNKLPGYRAENCGAIAEVRKVFPNIAREPIRKR